MSEEKSYIENMKIFKDFPILKELEEKLGVNALHVMELFEKTTGLKGYRITDRLVACIYIALREKQYPITVRELTRYFDDVKPKIVLRIVNKILNKYRIKLPFVNIEGIIERYGKQFNLTEEEINKAKEVSKIIRKIDKNPLNVAVSSIFIVIKDRIGITKFSRIVKVSEPTIRKNVQEYLRKISK
jgi:transcription initiation factor TFIIIB Brf1 subunit/transcription initiation factor TFIIB